MSGENRSNLYSCEIWKWDLKPCLSLEIDWRRDGNQKRLCCLPWSLSCGSPRSEPPFLPPGTTSTASSPSILRRNELMLVETWKGREKSVHEFERKRKGAAFAERLRGSHTVKQTNEKTGNDGSRSIYGWAEWQDEYAALKISREQTVNASPSFKDEHKNLRGNFPDNVDIDILWLGTHQMETSLWQTCMFFSALSDIWM